MKKTKSLIIGLICSILITSTAAAVTQIPNESKYFPEREGVPFVEGMQGFTYPTFNNFINNQNISSGGRQGDERQFMVAKHCPGGESGCAGQYFYNTLVSPLEEGDVIRFELYFHNNANDPYDGSGLSSPNAEDFRVGVQLDDIVDSVYDDLLRPRGFLYADNNQYLVDPDERNNVTVDQNDGKITSNHELFRDPNTNSVVRYAHDDIQTFISEYGMELQPVPGSAWLYMLLSHGSEQSTTDDVFFNTDDVFFDGAISSPTQLTFGTVTPDTISVNVSPYYTDDKMMLIFDELPGCFRYSGFAYFDAVVVSPPEIEPICEELLVDHSEEIFVGTLSRFKSEAFDTNNETFVSMIEYRVDPGYGKLYTEADKPTDVPGNPSSTVYETWNFEGGSVWGELDDIKGAGEEVPGSFILDNLGPSKTLFEVSIDIANGVLGEIVTDSAEYQVSPGGFSSVAHAAIFPIEEMAVDLFGGLDPLIFENIVDMSDTYLAVPQGTPVFLEALQPGEGVIQVKTLDSDEPGCEREFDIVSEPEIDVCDEILVNRPETITEGTLSEFSAKSLTPISDDFNGMIKYNVHPSNGQFFTTKPAGYTDNDSPMIIEFDDSLPIPTPQEGFFCSENIMAEGTIFANPGEKVWLYTEPEAEDVVIHIMTDCTDVLACNLHLDVEPSTETNVCTDLSVISDGVELAYIEPGRMYTLPADASYSGTPATEEITYTSTQGLFMGPISNDPLVQATIRGMINAYLKGIISSDYLNENIPPNLLSQLSTTLTVPDESIVYYITFTDANGTDALIIQATDRSEAVCINTYDVVQEVVPCLNIEVTHFPTPFDPLESTVISVQEGQYGSWTGNFEFSAPHGTFSTPGNEANPQTSFTQVETAAGIVYTPDANTATETDEITITATGPLSGTNCNYIITATPETIECIDLDIVQPSGTWNENDFTDTDEQRFRIEVETSPAGLINNFRYRWEVDSDDPDTEFQQSLTDQTDLNPLINYLLNINSEEETSVTIYAIDENNDPVPACEDQISLDTDEDDDEPEIEKVVYDPDSRDWEDVINMGGKDEHGDFTRSEDEYVTYLAVYEPGSEVETDIWDNTLENGEIQSSIGSAGGEFGFLGMLIAVEGKDGKDYIIYKDDVFDADRFRNEDDILDDIIEDFDEDFDYEDLDNIDLEDEYDCDDGDYKDNRVCIENHEDTEAEFQDGDKITLENLDLAKNIYIFYQMENGTKIDEDFCEHLMEEEGVCGEEYVNEINFETPEGYDGDDDAKVVIICPYILSREGGDVFFHSALETGFDISACYEVESGTGPVIRPRPEDEGGTPSTGPGEEEEEITLIAPTHDICKISNTDDPELAEAYRNVFKNFSSSVCEMETEVAEEWKEKYINEAIKANVEKLARFGIPYSQDLEIRGAMLTNDVFITENNITVDYEYFISSGAETYIIKGADLIINENITYDDSFVDLTNPKNIPSIAFIVIDGNIEIAPGVTQLDGIYMAVDTEGDVDGKITASEVSYEILTINGSLIGDIFELYNNRKGIGDPLKDESSITVRYDERILLNTPPGLTDLIDVNQLKVAN